MRYWAILRDSLAETLDRKSLYFLLIMSLLIIGFCASISFKELKPQETLEYIADSLRSVTVNKGTRSLQTVFPFHAAVSDFKEFGDDAGDFAGGYQVTVTITKVPDFHAAVHAWAATRSSRKTEPKVGDPGQDAEQDFVRTGFWEAGVSRVEVRRAPGVPEERVFSVKMRPSSKKTLEGSHAVQLLFGAYAFKLERMSVAVFLTLVEITVADLVAGWLGLLIAIVFTAGFIPTMFQKGTLDLILAKPVGRGALLLTKYAGGLLYVMIPAIFLVGGSWLVLSIRAGYFNVGFLASIGVLMALFAVLYSFSVLMGVLLRNTIAAVSLTLLLWGTTFMINTVRNLNAIEGWDLPPAAVHVLDGLHAVLPKTSDLAQMTKSSVARGNLGTEFQMVADRITQDGSPPVKPVLVWVTSAMFIAAMLGLACWTFSRRDY